MTEIPQSEADCHRILILAVEHVGQEADLCGGYRHGFTCTTSFALKDYRIDYDLGLASQEVELLLSDKGIHK